jgi:hypothetical protein
MNKLMEHARGELLLLGESERTISAYLDVIQAFSDMSGVGSAPSEVIPIILKLLYFKNITPLTTDPAEWEEVGSASGRTKNLWQSKRDPEAFSTDGGKTYYILSERDIDPNSIHVSELSIAGG